jgi:uncharacterized membrane protein
LSLSTTSTPGFTLASAAPKVKLKAGKPFKVKLSAKQISSSVPAGTYHVLVSVTDPNGATTTVDTGKTMVVEPAQIDLSGAFVKVPSSVKAGRTGTVQVLVTNRGNVEANGRLTIDLSTSKDQNPIDATGIIATPGSTLHLKPGKSVKLTLKFPAGAASASYHLIAQLDPNDAFHDVNRLNNVFATSGLISVT